MNRHLNALLEDVEMDLYEMDELYEDEYDLYDDEYDLYDDEELLEAEIENFLDYLEESEAASINRMLGITPTFRQKMNRQLRDNPQVQTLKQYAGTLKQNAGTLKQNAKQNASTLLQPQMCDFFSLY